MSPGCKTLTPFLFVLEYFQAFASASRTAIARAGLLHRNAEAGKQGQREKSTYGLEISSKS